MNQIFRTQKTITFRESDPVGIMFFGNIFGFAHDAFEQFIVVAGYTYAEWFEQRQILMPIRHTDAEFFAPFRPGHTYDIAVTVGSFGQNSFKMKYVFSEKNKSHAVVTMVHTVVDAATMQKTPLSALMKSRLSPYLEPNSPT